jgi:hypothetical protein
MRWAALALIATGGIVFLVWPEETRECRKKGELPQLSAYDRGFDIFKRERDLKRRLDEMVEETRCGPLRASVR